MTAGIQQSPLFPDATTLTKTDDGSEYIYGGSIGLNRVLGYFRDHAYDTHRPIWALYLINVLTIARNVYTKGMTYQDFVAKVDLDGDLFITYAEAYSAVGHNPVHPLFVFYLPSYTKIPTHRRRVPPESQKEFYAYYERMRSSAHTVAKTTPSGYTWFLTTPVGSQTLPHRDLIHLLRQITSQSVGSLPRIALDMTRTPYAMVSHVAMDWHIAATFPNFSLLESYTGTIRHVRELGVRLTKDNDIPFNRYTHQLLGDKDILLPWVKGKEKQDILAVALRNKWPLCTSDKIMMDIMQTLKKTREEMTELKI